MSDAPEWISLTAVNLGWVLSLPHERDGTDVRYTRADVSAARLADLERQVCDADQLATERLRTIIGLERQLAEAVAKLSALPAQTATDTRGQYAPDMKGTP